MYLYHYSKDLYPTLTTRLSRADKNLSSQEITDAKQTALSRGAPGSYLESISFFFDPIPLNMIGKHFQNNHHTWFNGNRLHQYVVLAASLERDILYNIVETPADIEEMGKVDWEDPTSQTDEFLNTYMQAKNKRKLTHGEQGRGVTNLIKNAKRYVGGTEKAYKANNKLSKEEQEYMRSMYAANVPHVMLYPHSGEIRYFNTSPVVVGQIATENHSSVSPVTLPRW